MRTAMLVMGFILISCTFTKGQETEITEGYNIIYYPTGQKSSEGTIRNGKPDGYWKTYYPNGILKSEGNRKNHILDSLWIFYNEAGDTVQKVSYVMGKRNGYTINYRTATERDPLDRELIVSRELYVNDSKEGISYYYDRNGNITEEVEYRNNRRSGIAREYDSEGRIITIKTYNNGVLVDRENINRRDEDGLRQGLWRAYYDDGSLQAESYYEDDQLSGQYKEYDRQGDISLILQYNKGLLVEDVDTTGIEVEIRNRYDNAGNLIYSGSFRDSVPIGIHREYNEAGEVVHAFLYNENGRVTAEGIITPEGSREGNWIYYYEDGSKRSEGRFVNNQEQGIWNFYFADGSVEQDGNFSNGRANGLWTWYYEEGMIKREEEYYNDLEEGTSYEYDTTGNIIASGSYFDGEKEGEWNYEVGDYRERGSYVAGLRDGIWEAWYADGTLKYEGEYIQGNPDGFHRFYYPNGVLKEENYYVMGRSERNWKKYDEMGNLIITITYRDNREFRINGERIDFPPETGALQ